MTNKFQDLIRDLLKEWSREQYKTVNFTDTYSKKALDRFLTVVSDWTYHGHCVEDREAMTQRDRGKVIAEIHSTQEGGETTVRKISGNKLEQQLEVDQRRAENTLIDEVNSVIREELNKSKDKVHVKVCRNDMA